MNDPRMAYIQRAVTHKQLITEQTHNYTTLPSSRIAFCATVHANRTHPNLRPHLNLCITRPLRSVHTCT